MRVWPVLMSVILVVPLTLTVGTGPNADATHGISQCDRSSTTPTPDVLHSETVNVPASSDGAWKTMRVTLPASGPLIVDIFWNYTRFPTKLHYGYDLVRPSGSFAATLFGGFWTWEQSERVELNNAILQTSGPATRSSTSWECLTIIPTSGGSTNIPANTYILVLEAGGPHVSSVEFRTRTDSSATLVSEGSGTDVKVYAEEDFHGQLVAFRKERQEQDHDFGFFGTNFATGESVHAIHNADGPSFTSAKTTVGWIAGFGEVASMRWQTPAGPTFSSDCELLWDPPGTYRPHVNDFVAAGAGTDVPLVLVSSCGTAGGLIAPDAVMGLIADVDLTTAGLSNA